METLKHLIIQQQFSLKSHKTKETKTEPSSRNNSRIQDCIIKRRGKYTAESRRESSIMEIK